MFYKNATETSRTFNKPKKLLSMWSAVIEGFIFKVLVFRLNHSTSYWTAQTNWPHLPCDLKLL